MPSADVQRSNTGFAPLFGQVVWIGTGPVGVVEKGPSARAAQWQGQSQIDQRMNQVGEALVALRAGADRDPQDRAFFSLESGDQRRARVFLLGENSRSGRQIEHRQFERLLPVNVKLRRSRIGDLSNSNPGRGRAEPKLARGWRVSDHNAEAVLMKGGFQPDRLENS